MDCVILYLETEKGIFVVGTSKNVHAALSKTFWEGTSLCFLYNNQCIQAHDMYT